jgi:hypothetical protein
MLLEQNESDDSDTDVVQVTPVKRSRVSEKQEAEVVTLDDVCSPDTDGRKEKESEMYVHNSLINARLSSS